MTPERRQQLLDRYLMAVNAVGVAVDQVSDDELDVRPDARSWSAREVIHHLGDSSMYNGVTLRRMLAENTPVLLHFDEIHTAERLNYDRPIKTSLEAFRSNSLANIELLGALTEDQWRREGNQQKPWHLTVEDWLSEEVMHVHNRLMQILNAPTGGRVIADSEEGLKLER